MYPGQALETDCLNAYQLVPLVRALPPMRSAMIGSTLKAALGLVGELLLGVASFFRSQWNSYNPLGQFLYVLAVVAIGIDAAISYQYGSSMSGLHAAGFALVAITFCIMPDIALTEFGKGNRKGGLWFAIACVPLGLVAYQTHIGYGAGVRLGDIQQASFQHSTLANADSSLKSEREMLALFRTQHATLSAKNAEHAAKHKGWLVTVDPVAMQSQLDAMDSRIKNEAARVKCGRECDKLKTERGQLAALIAGIKEENELTGRIERTQKVIDAKEAKIAGMGYQSSTVINQNDTFAKLWNVGRYMMGHDITPEQAIQPTPVQRDLANTATAGSASLAFMICGGVLMAAAGRNRKAGGLDPHEPPPGDVKPVDYHAPAPVPTSAVPVQASSSVVPIRVPQPAMQAVQDRRDRVKERLAGMRQSRIDSSLLAA
jgi:hypothetical protein